LPDYVIPSGHPVRMDISPTWLARIEILANVNGIDSSRKPV